MELLRAIARAYPGPDRRVWIHPLPRRRARQKLKEYFEVFEPSKNFVNTDD
jgi:hypothetical protein